jgi:pimeloyl-ACP methyl ester carboxylesterase
MSAAPQHVTIDWAGRPVQIECLRLNAARTDQPLLVFLHEGLGSISLWRDFPQRLCDALGWRGLVYSRPGYGQSTPRAADERWAPDFMHRQAHEVLPALLDALDVTAPVWLLGHSDGGSIALLHAAQHPDRVAGTVVVAPHLFVEELSVESITSTRETYLSTDLKQRLARHHADPDSAFWGWNDIWLHPDFRAWNIEAEVARISGPLLAVQGSDDEYGTLAQIQAIARLAPQTRLAVFEGCGHSPHRDQPEGLIAAVTGFVAAQAAPAPTPPEQG